MGNPRTAEMAALPVSPEVPNSIKKQSYSTDHITYNISCITPAWVKSAAITTRNPIGIPEDFLRHWLVFVSKYMNSILTTSFPDSRNR